jgi:RimJ/RimL family protein N-acetyltransferase
LLLRDFREEDLIPFRKIGNNDEALKYYSQTPAEWGSHVEYLVKLFMESQIEVPRQKYTLAIITGGSFIGTVSVRIDSPEHRQGSIGCVLAYKYWSQGYASEAMTAALNLGFEKLKLHRIYAETISENRAALALAERQAMRIEGVLRENQYFKGRWWNTTILALLRTEWRNRAAG